LSIIDSIVLGIGTLLEAKIGPVKSMPKSGMDSCRLHALAFNYLDLLFRQPVKLVDQGGYPTIGGFYLALVELGSSACLCFFVLSKRRDH
jgi:hypothetical protein